jgi:hypothetical protein
MSATDRIPAFVPEPRDPRERLLEALTGAAKSFEEGDTKMGIASLNHALWTALTARPEVSEKEARAFYKRIEDAAKPWEQEL